MGNLTAPYTAKGFLESTLYSGFANQGVNYAPKKRPYEGRTSSSLAGSYDNKSSPIKQSKDYILSTMKDAYNSIKDSYHKK